MQSMKGPTSILRPLRLLVAHQLAGASGTAITSRYSESERQQGGQVGVQGEA